MGVCHRSSDLREGCLLEDILRINTCGSRIASWFSTGEDFAPCDIFSNLWRHWHFLETKDTAKYRVATIKWNYPAQNVTRLSLRNSDEKEDTGWQSQPRPRFTLWGPLVLQCPTKAACIQQASHGRRLRLGRRQHLSRVAPLGCRQS